jgi:hypothetical protein
MVRLVTVFNGESLSRIAVAIFTILVIALTGLAIVVIRRRVTRGRRITAARRSGRFGAG